MINSNPRPSPSGLSLLTLLAAPLLLGAAFASAGCAAQDDEPLAADRSLDSQAAIARQGDVGAEVEKSYRYLHRYGYLGDAKLPGDPQVFDASLKEALLRYQEIQGLPADGTLNRETLAKMAQPRCGHSDAELVKKHQEDGPSANFTIVTRWPKRIITYRHVNYTADLTALQVQTAVANAFSAWSSANPLLTFFSQSTGADVPLLFVAGAHGDSTDFDGAGGILAHSEYPTTALIHFDEDETWTTNGTGGPNLFSVSLHEIGHVLGLGHSVAAGSIMQATYSNQTSLGSDDVLAIKTNYPPLAPNPFTVYNAACYGENQAQWTAQAGATHYELYRSSSPSFTSQVLLFSGNSVSETVTAPTNGTWWLRVRACSAVACGDYSTTDAATYYPGCP